MIKKKKNLEKERILTLILFLACLFQPLTAKAQTKDVVSDAKNGIVEVYSGFLDGSGTFHRMKYGSGFLISNDEKGTYIVTSQSILENSEEEKEKYCADNSIAIDSVQTSDAVRVVVRNDVTVEASVLAESEEWDFSILSVGQAVGEKMPLKLGDNRRLLAGDAVYAAGYPNNPQNLEFSAADVEIFQGNIQDNEAGRSGKSYIQHSARVSDGNAGGPLLDADGYVVGINCKAYSDASSGRYYSLPANAVEQVLYNFDIPYGSREQEEAAVKKKMQIIINVLAGLILLLILWLISLLILNRRDKREEPHVQQVQNEQRVQSKGKIVQGEEEDRTIVLPAGRQAKNTMHEQVRRFFERTEELWIEHALDGQAVMVDKPEYILGKSMKEVDFPIPDNKAVSRIHACISWKADEFFISDLGSLNGTYLQGKRLGEGAPEKLSDGDVVLLADEKFKIRICKTKLSKEEKDGI